MFTMPDDQPYLAAEQTHEGGLYVHGTGPFGRFAVRFDPHGAMRESVCELSGEVTPCFGCPQDTPATKLPPATVKRTPWQLGPGDLIAYLIMALTLGKVRPCASCRSRRKKLNDWGWRGCLPWLIAISAVLIALV